MNYSVLLLRLHHILGQKALADAGIPYSAIEQACVGYVYGKTLLLNPIKCNCYILFTYHAHTVYAAVWHSCNILYTTDLITLKLTVNKKENWCISPDCNSPLIPFFPCSFRGLHMWAEGHLPQPGPDRDPHHQRQQQLLHRLHCSLHGTPAGPGRWVKMSICEDFIFFILVIVTFSGSHHRRKRLQCP